MLTPSEDIKSKTNFTDKTTCTNTVTNTNLSRLRSFSCHNLNSCSKASSSHPCTTASQPLPPSSSSSSPSPSPLCFSLISPRTKVTFLSPHPSTRTPPPRSALTAAHSRRCQAEIILSVKLSNEARRTHAPKNKHTLEL